MEVVVGVQLTPPLFLLKFENYNNIIMNGNNQNRFCQYCGVRWVKGHANVCPVRQGGQQQVVVPQQNQPQAQGVPAVRALSEEVQRLVRRVQTLETTRLAVPTLVGRASMRLRHPGQPAGTENRVFTCQVVNITSGPTNNWLHAARLNVDDQLPGFSDWAQGFTRVSITSIAVTYTHNTSGYLGGGVVLLGFDRASRGDADGATVLRFERREIVSMFSSGHLFVEYGTRTPFERYLVGTPSGRTVRPWGRVYVQRSARQWTNTAGQAANVDAGFVHLEIQCACTRESS